MTPMIGLVVGALIAAVALFFGVEIGYVWAGHGAPETPQTWTVVAGILALLLVIALSLQLRRTS